MLAGEMEKIDLEVKRLATRRTAVAEKHAALAKVSALAEVPQLPQVVPPVRAHHPYGGRGNLRNFLREALRAVYPGALDSRTIAEVAVHHFWETFESDEQRQYFKRERVTHTLQKLVRLGEVERLHPAATNAVGGWRWKVDEPSIVDLIALRGDLVEG
jgi:hypothetical protein